MTFAIPAARLLRRTAGTRKPSAARLLAAALSVTSLLSSGCASLGGKNMRLAEERAQELSQTQAKATALEGKVADLQRDNARLVRRIAELETGIRSAQSAAANAAKSAENAATPMLRGGADADARAVVSTADANRALANPMQAAPRLVQPAFAAQEQTVFENEAKGDIPVASVLYGAHLASYRRSVDALAGWRVLQRQNPSELSLLEPRVAPITIEGRGAFIRLIAGGFSTQETAAKLCETLKRRGRFCEVTSFDGEKLNDR